MSNSRVKLEQRIPSAVFYDNVNDDDNDDDDDDESKKKSSQKMTFWGQHFKFTPPRSKLRRFGFKSRSYSLGSINDLQNRNRFTPMNNLSNNIEEQENASQNMCRLSGALVPDNSTTSGRLDLLSKYWFSRDNNMNNCEQKTTWYVPSISVDPTTQPNTDTGEKKFQNSDSCLRSDPPREIVKRGVIDSLEKSLSNSDYHPKKCVPFNARDCLPTQLTKTDDLCSAQTALNISANKHMDVPLTALDSPLSANVDTSYANKGTHCENTSISAQTNNSSIINTDKDVSERGDKSYVKSLQLGVNHCDCCADLANGSCTRCTCDIGIVTEKDSDKVYNDDSDGPDDVFQLDDMKPPAFLSRKLRRYSSGDVLGVKYGHTLSVCQNDTVNKLIKDSSSDCSPCLKCSRGHILESCIVHLVDIQPDLDKTNDIKCSTVRILERFTLPVCHHPTCMEKNEDRPLLLCPTCDKSIHSSIENSGHLVFDAPLKGNLLTRGTMSIPSARGTLSSHSDSEIERDEYDENDNEADGMDSADGIFKQKSDSNIGFNSNESKLRRKKAVKCRRYHTELHLGSLNLLSRKERSKSSIGPINLSAFTSQALKDDKHVGEIHERSRSMSEYFNQSDNHTTDCLDRSNNNTVRGNRQWRYSLPAIVIDNPETLQNINNNGTLYKSHQRQNSKVNNEECFTITFKSPKLEDGSETVVVAALKSVTLRDCLAPLLEQRDLDINFVNAFVEASNTPLPLNCETFLLGGNTLFIKEKEGIEQQLSRTKSVPISSKPQLSSARERDKVQKPNGIFTKTDSLPNATTLTPHSPTQRRGSDQLPFRERLLIDVKNEHPLAKNNVFLTVPVQECGLVPSQKRGRPTNLSVDDTMTILPAISPLGTWSSAERKTSRSQSKLTNLFSPVVKDREKHEQLSDLLNSYTANGLPNMPDLLTMGQPKFDQEIFQLEPHWSSIVDNASSLTKRQHDQQEAIWELLQTEVHYIKALRVITDLLMCVILNLQQELILNEIDIEKLFSNMPQVLMTNNQFWSEDLLQVLQHSRETRKPLNPSLMKSGFKKFSESFQPYTKYCLDQRNCLEYTKAWYRDSELFKTFVVWSEAQKQCNRLKLNDLLVKPMQRLTKYSLLLQAILRKSEDERQRRDLLEMIGNVDRFVYSVDGALSVRHEHDRLATVAGKIESYDAVEAPNDECKEVLQEFSTIDLWSPMPGCGSQPRSLIIQSGLKMKDAQTRVDVECLLFTDMLLVCKSNKRMDKYRVIKPPLRVDKLSVHELRDKGSFLIVYMNEYRLAVLALTFHTDQASVRMWTEHIKKAQALYAVAKASAASERLVSDPVQVNVDRNTSSNGIITSESCEDLILVNNLGTETSVPPVPTHRARSLTTSDFCDNDSVNNEDDVVRLLEKSIEDSERNHIRDSSDSDEYSAVLNKDISGDQQQQSALRHKHVYSSVSLPPSSSVPALPQNPDDQVGCPYSIFEDEEGARYKLNQRRLSRSERRYHTADSIQDMDRIDKDPAIYKRLSWNLGTVDIHLEEKQNRLHSKTMSSDSLRSVHSSSGVSSTGSVHHENETLSEESETETVKVNLKHLNDNQVNINNISDDRAEDSSNLSSDHENQPQVKVTPRPHPHPRRLKAADKSRSAPNFVSLLPDLTPTEMKDGISSIELPSVDGKKKLTYSQMLRVRKQLLLNSDDVEASEV